MDDARDEYFDAVQALYHDEENQTDWMGLQYTDNSHRAEEGGGNNSILQYKYDHVIEKQK